VLITVKNSTTSTLPDTNPGSPSQSDLSTHPKPDTAYVLEILYFAKPTPMSDSVSSNVFLANYPDALLYAALLEAEPYLINDARTQTWATLYDRAIGNIQSSDQNSEYSGVPLTMRVTSR
jgi:hypothetical protein